MGVVERNYATLTRSNESASRLAMDVLRLAPHLDAPQSDDVIYRGEYQVSRPNLNFIIKAFISDAGPRLDEKQQPVEPRLDRPRFSLGFSALLLEELKDETTGFASVPIPSLHFESLVVEGGVLEGWVADRLGVKLKRYQQDFPLRLRATFGGEDIIDITEPDFEPHIAAKGLVQSFYRRYRIADLSTRDPGKLATVNRVPDVVDEVGTMLGDDYEYTDADEPPREDDPADPEDPRFF